MKTAIEAERVDVLVDPQESLLVHVPGIFRRAQKIEREPEHTMIVGAHQLLESVLVAALNGPDQRRFI